MIPDILLGAGLASAGVLSSFLGGTPLAVIGRANGAFLSSVFGYPEVFDAVALASVTFFSDEIPVF